MIVNDDREHIGRGAIRAQQDEIVEIFVLPNHATLNLVFDDCLSRQWCLDADDRIDAGWNVLWIAIAATSIIETCAAFGPSLLAHRGKLVLAAVTAIAVT